MRRGAAETYLERVRGLMADIQREEANIRRCEDALEVHGVSFDETGTARASGRVSPAMVALINARDEFEDKSRKAAVMMREADHIVGLIGDPTARQAIAMRYLENLNFSQIALGIGYTKEGARRLVAREVAAMDEWIDDERRRWLRGDMSKL